MTVISTIITRHFTAHASDSYISSRLSDGTRKVHEDQQSKLVRVPAWRGAMGYWGLASYGRDWNTLDWLREQANQADKLASPGEFADSLAAMLNQTLSRLGSPLDAGLGIHFTAYERVGGYWVPELFLVTNWTDASYTRLRPEGFRATRETYAILKDLTERLADHGEAGCRLEVHAALHDYPLMFMFNNGDPVLFNPIAKAMMDSFLELSARGHLMHPTSYRTHLSLARRPIEAVAKLLVDVADPATRLIGGKPHDLAVSPGGVYYSTTGD